MIIICRMVSASCPPLVLGEWRAQCPSHLAKGQGPWGGTRGQPSSPERLSPGRLSPGARAVSCCARRARLGLRLTLPTLWGNRQLLPCLLTLSYAEMFQNVCFDSGSPSSLTKKFWRPAWSLEDPILISLLGDHLLWGFNTLARFQFWASRVRAESYDHIIKREHWFAAAPRLVCVHKTETESISSNIRFSHPVRKATEVFLELFLRIIWIFKKYLIIVNIFLPVPQTTAFNLDV